MNYLRDTNILTCLHHGRLLESLPKGGYACSVISEIEILSWPGIAPRWKANCAGCWLSCIASRSIPACAKPASAGAASTA